MSMIDAAAKLPSSIDAKAALDRDAGSLRRQSPCYEAVASVAEDLVLRRFGKRTHAPVMRAHDHQHPSARRASFREPGDGVGERAQTQLETVDAARLRNPEQAGADDGRHAGVGELAGGVTFAGMGGERPRKRGGAAHDFIMVYLHSHSISQIAHEPPACGKRAD